MARPEGTKYIETPEKLWELFESYREETLKNKLLVPQSHPKLGIVYLDFVPPLSEQDFERWLANQGVITNTREYFTCTKDSYKHYLPISTRIKNEVFAHNFKYSAVGALKENLIARQLGLADNKNNTNTNIEQPLFNDVPKDNSDKQDTSS